MLRGGSSGWRGSRGADVVETTDIDLKENTFENSTVLVLTYLENFLGNVSGAGLSVLEVSLSRDSTLFFFS